MKAKSMAPVITPLTPTEEAKDEASALKEGYLHRVLVGFDMFVNVVANGHPSETISSRSSRAAAEGKRWGKVMCGFLNLFQSNHGPKAQAGDIARADTIEYLENSSGTLPKP